LTYFLRPSTVAFWRSGERKTTPITFLNSDS
jgi:hypothetical protein